MQPQNNQNSEYALPQMPTPGAITQPGSNYSSPAQLPQQPAPQMPASVQSQPINPPLQQMAQQPTQNTIQQAPQAQPQINYVQTQAQPQPNYAPNPQPQAVPQAQQQTQQAPPFQAQQQPQVSQGSNQQNRNHQKNKKNNEKTTPTSTQNSLLIAEIRDGMVIMKDGSLRAVVMCQSINFDLMSPKEREAVEYGYQGFLNSLYFPVQIVVRSLKVDLDNYMDKLEHIRNQQQNVMLQFLMEDYMNYVHYLLESSNIMDKQFYVVVPYYPPATTQAGLATGVRKFTNLFKQNNSPITINEADFNKYRTELAQRVQVILNGLSSMAIQSVPLNTQELIELYYSFYNPETAAHQGLSNIHELESSIITKGVKEQEGRAF
ncbi:MAG: hypothetical protein WDZ81_00670 [Candidatus Saccharimonadales bacterium]